MRTWNSTFYSTSALTGTFSTSALKIEYTTGCAVQAIYTGGPTGALSLLASNDGINFSTIANSSNSITGPGNYIWNLLSPGFEFIQGNFTASSASSGTMAFNFNSKGF